MRKLLIMAFVAIALVANAQENTKKWYDNIKFSGYSMLQFQATDKYSNKTITKEDGTKETIAVKDADNAFNLRLARFMLDGKISDFDWRVQIQGTNAKGAGEPTVQLVDLYAEWVRYKEARIKVGQFKRAFTFENPMNPITQGWYSYANVVNALSGFGDRTGEKSSGGRDIGLQVQGDLFPNAQGRRLLHYQVGVYNGEGINTKEKDERKDFIGGVWVMPIAGLRLGVFGWTGSRGGMTDPRTGQTVSMEKNRYALSAEYDKNEYTFRAEYLHSQGWGADKVGSTTIDYSKGDKADGLYALGIVPVIKSKLHAKARYQLYRDNKDWKRSKTMYEVGANYFFNKNLQLNVEYARVNDRSIVCDKHNYNFFDAELDFRF
ncbi:MAG: porin [Bacteroidaceae bacterium]|nr:porin [Bacteroidaceae bacterium]